MGNVVELVHEAMDHDRWVGSQSIMDRRCRWVAEFTEVELGGRKRGRGGLHRDNIGRQDSAAQQRWTTAATQASRGDASTQKRRRSECEGL
jgi:hypothetical protein